MAEPSLVVMQPTTLCNLDCSYCYLPERDQNLRMLPLVARAVAMSVEPWAQQRTVEICWHGGEPLTVGRTYLGQLMDAFTGLNVVHSVQTNATLITPAWSRFLRQRDVQVGVSIDGPQQSNINRVDRNGRSAHERIQQGIRRLVADGHDVAAIAVVSDPTPRRARALYEYVVELGCRWLGINIEEREGINTRQHTHSTADVAEFWAELFRCWQQEPRIELREAHRALAYAQALLDEQPLPAPALDPLPTVAWNGSVTLLSPELAGFRSSRFGDFSCGSVLHDSLSELIARGSQAPWVAEYVRGLDSCRRSCDYFDFCGGGTAANRHFETGRLDITETDYCRTSKIALMEGVLTHVDSLTG